MIVKQWRMKTWLACTSISSSDTCFRTWLFTLSQHDSKILWWTAQCKGLGLFRLLAHGREPIHRACLHLWNRSSFGWNCGDSNLNDFLIFLHLFTSAVVISYRLLPLFLSLCHMPIGLDRPILIFTLYAMMWYLFLYIYTHIIYIWYVTYVYMYMTSTYSI